MSRRRLDAELVRRGLAVDRTAAQALIDQGRVRVGGAPATNAARQVDSGEALLVDDPPAKYVGRGAEKLERALDAFGLDPTGLRVLDAGASTGGFTDALLQRGAAQVVALDVGHGQLHERIRNDDRVVVLERTNLRLVDPNELGPFDAVVADLSFISLTSVMKVLVELCAPGAWLVLLVKPQFEVERAVADRSRGVITDSGEWRRSILRVLDAATGAGAEAVDVVVSPLRGAAGNVEFLAHLVVPGTAEGEPTPVRAWDAGRLDRVIDDAEGRTGAQ